MLKHVVFFYPSLLKYTGDYNIYNLERSYFQTLSYEFDDLPSIDGKWELLEKKSEILSFYFRQSIIVSPLICEYLFLYLLPNYSSHQITFTRGTNEFKEYKHIFIKETGIKYVDFSKTLFEDKESILPKFITLNSYENFVSKNYWCKTVFYTPEVHKFDLFYSHLKGFWLCSDKFKTVLIKNRIHKRYFSDLSEYNGEIIVP